MLIFTSLPAVTVTLTFKQRETGQILQFINTDKVPT